MISLAFILGIIGATIGLLIGILVFSAVTESINCDGSFLNEEEKESCNRAVNTAWIVVSILPIALFFALFTIFGGVGGGQSMRVISISNIEERAKKMEKLGVAHILKKTKAQIIDRSKRGNELYIINMIPNYPLKYLKYEDPSTANKVYGCFVPSIIESADEAMAWKFQITEEEYVEDLIFEA
jgi:hypothetical protein